MSKTLLKLYIYLQLLANFEDGQDLIEYGFLVSLIALICILSMQDTARALDHLFERIRDTLRYLEHRGRR
jgi:Flp pilus assembly pilin Flp